MPSDRIFVWYRFTHRSHFCTKLCVQKQRSRNTCGAPAWIFFLCVSICCVFLSVFIWTLSVFSSVLSFVLFCSKPSSDVEPNDATLEVDTEQLVKPYLLSTTAFCHWLYAHMCLSPISAIILELREERNLRCWFVLFCFPCLGFYKRAENRFWPAMAWTVYCSCPDMPRDKYAKTFSFIYVQYIQTASFLHNRKVTARFP